MPKELFNQPLIVVEPDDNDRLGFGQPSVAGGKNMVWSVFKTIVKGFTSVFDWLDLTPQAIPPAQVEGRLFYDDVLKTFTSYNDIAGSSLQNGRELWKRLINDTGITITNGQVVYISGESGGIETAGLAQANLQAKSVSTIAVATNDYNNGDPGEYTRIGIIRDLNTLAYAPGTIMWLSATVAGAITNVRPSSPNWAVRVGTIGVQSATVGTLDIDIDISNNTGDVIKIFNGSILEDHTITVDSDGAIVTLSLEKNGGGDLSLFFNGEFTIFDSTPPATVPLTAGTDEVPVQNWVYIPESTGVLTANTSGFPTNEQVVPVADILVQTAASLQTYGCRKCQAWTDHLSNSVGQGHLAHVNYWIRKQPATHQSGTLGLFSIVVQGGAIDDMYFNNNVGIVLQLHDHTFPVRDLAISDSIWVYNDFTTKNNRITNLNLITLTSNGLTLRNQNTYYSIVVFGVVSESQVDCKLYALSPLGFYANTVDAISDPLGFTDKTIPDEFIGSGFLISRGVYRYQTGGSGTVTLEFTEDLRKVSVGGGGGTSSQTTEFTDAIFKILNASDPTKEMQFIASQITTGTTRSLTIPDASGLMSLIQDSPDNQGIAYYDLATFKLKTSLNLVFDGANLGIAMINPYGRLGVNGTAHIGIYQSSPLNSSNLGILQLNQQSDTNADGLAVNSTTGKSVRLWVDNTDTVRMDGGGTGQLNISLNSGGIGNVAIGQVAALAKLDVNGHIMYNTEIVSLAVNTTLDATYKNKIVECTGTITITLPDGMTTGYKVDIINVDTGVITMAATTTLQSKDSNTKLASQYGGISAYHRGSNVWLIVGDLTA